MLHLDGVGALLVDQLVVEGGIRSLVAEKDIRQLYVDLLRTHYCHFVEHSSRHLWERGDVKKAVIFYQNKTCKSSATFEISSATVASKSSTGSKTVSPRWAR